MDCYLKTVVDGSNIFQVFYTLLLGICRRFSVKTLETSLPFHLPFLCYQSPCLLWKLCVQFPTLEQLNFMTIVFCQVQEIACGR
jgi:hypothetical protein